MSWNNALPGFAQTFDGKCKCKCVLHSSVTTRHSKTNKSNKLNILRIPIATGSLGGRPVGYTQGHPKNCSWPEPQLGITGFQVRHRPLSPAASQTVLTSSSETTKQLNELTDGWMIFLISRCSSAEAVWIVNLQRRSTESCALDSLRLPYFAISAT